jgi:hypothetical protein
LELRYFFCSIRVVPTCFALLCLLFVCLFMMFVNSTSRTLLGNCDYSSRTTTHTSPTTVSLPYDRDRDRDPRPDLGVLGRQGYCHGTMHPPPARCTCHPATSSHARIEALTPGYTLFDFVAACGRSTGVPLWLACSRWSMAFQSLHHSAEGGGLNVVFEFGGSAMLWLECWGEDEGKDEMHVILYE